MGSLTALFNLNIVLRNRPTLGGFREHPSLIRKHDIPITVEGRLNLGVVKDRAHRLGNVSGAVDHDLVGNTPFPTGSQPN